MRLRLSTEQIIESIEHAIRERVEGADWAAPKTVITPPDDPRYMMAALAAMDGTSFFGGQDHRPQF